MAEAIGYSLFGVQPSELLTGAFVSLAIGPVLTSTIERYRAKKDDDPPPPPSVETEDSEESFHQRHGYYEMRAA